MSQVLCPKCGSDKISAEKKGFSGKKAVIGTIVAGEIGALAGTIGSNQIKITCLSCGNVFNPGEGAKSEIDFRRKKKKFAVNQKNGAIGCLVIIVFALIVGSIEKMSSCNNSQNNYNSTDLSSGHMNIDSVNNQGKFDSLIKNSDESK
jgi:predicted RNA-binding Zn-ribbon protein involved in translation (DUF1610 family)